MLLAILLVLILIAVILAPWLIPTALALASLYGAVMVVAGGVVVISMVAGFAFLGVKAVVDARKAKQQSIESAERQRRQIEEGARIIREKEALLEAKKLSSEPTKPYVRKKMICQCCSAEIDRSCMFCPVCGKNPRVSTA